MTIAVTDLFRYPVKSMGGHAMHSAQVGENGFAGDRCWALKDEARGGFKSGKRYAAIMGIRAQLSTEPTASQPSPPAILTFADGDQTSTDDPHVNDKLSAAIDHPVSIWPLAPAHQLDHYRRQPAPHDVNPQTALREVFARAPDEPLPDLSGFPPELFHYESPPGTYFDAFPVLLISRNAVASLAAHRTQSRFDLRRFRPNIVVDTPQPGFVEDTWAGRTGRIGGAVLKFEMACPRCVMTTHGFADLPSDPGVMRALVQANDGNLGIYARVIEAGEIQIGDRLELDD